MNSIIYQDICTYYLSEKVEFHGITHQQDVYDGVEQETKHSRTSSRRNGSNDFTQQSLRQLVRVGVHYQEENDGGKKSDLPLLPI